MDVQHTEPSLSRRIRREPASGRMVPGVPATDCQGTRRAARRTALARSTHNADNTAFGGTVWVHSAPALPAQLERGELKLAESGICV